MFQQCFLELILWKLLATWDSLWYWKQSVFHLNSPEKAHFRLVLMPHLFHRDFGRELYWLWLEWGSSHMVLCFGKTNLFNIIKILGGVLWSVWVVVVKKDVYKLERILEIAVRMIKTWAKKKNGKTFFFSSKLNLKPFCLEMA